MPPVTVSSYSEKTSDIEAISEVTRAAFENHPHGNQTEQYIVSALRAANALAVSLVAQIEGQVVGHIAFSPVTISGSSCDWYGPGPISVLPDYQRQGIGQSLVNEGLRLLRASGAKGYALAGGPDFSERFGFRSHPDLILEGVPQENFLALPFGEEDTRGVVVFHEGFNATE
ncbi:MAG: N-acetyltransferase [Actinobacteria bacterium]|nr:N-acetyltransferase [Actinomycetota bacterium]MBU1944272.1 N-acetyltransferase [Actinomycetota bacterium]MBU2688825.1 N-acetyltransferase [Actinomycetota bacterium]